jgi:hypothetical protein
MSESVHCLFTSLSVLVLLCAYKAIPVTGRGGPYDFEALRLPHFLGNPVTDGGKVVSLTRRPSFTPQEYSRCSFLLEAKFTHRAIVRLEVLGKLKKSNDLIGNRTRYRVPPNRTT